MENLELSTTSILALFETNKEQRKDFVARVVQSIESGDVDPLKVHLQVKMMEDVIKNLNANSRYKSAVLERAEKYGQKSFEFGNAKVEIKETGVKYDFSKCEDDVLAKLNELLEDTESKIKARETLLKAAPGEGLVLTNPETGETKTVYPPARSSITNVVITLK
jgi:hypothetical protein